MDLKVSNFTNPTFQANVVIDSSYEKLGKFANQNILPKLKDSLKALGSNDVTVTLKGNIIESDWTSNKIVAEITKELSSIAPKLSVFISRLRDFPGYEYNKFVKDIKNAIEDL